MQKNKNAAASPAISILTPVFNGMPFIKECISSVIQQNFSDWELLIGDNGSTDGSREWLKQFADPRIRIFEHDTNKGAFGNLNSLFHSARAPITQILCHDDYLLENALETILEVWTQQDDEVAFIRFNRGHLDYHCPNLIYMQKVLPRVIQSKHSALYFYLFGCLAGNISNVSVRTSVVLEHGGFRNEYLYVGDFEFWSRVAMDKPFAISEKNISFIRRHPRQASNYVNQSGEAILQLISVYENLFKIILSEHPDPLTAQILRNHYIAAVDYYQWNAAFRHWIRSGNLVKFRYLLSPSTLSGKCFNRFRLLLCSLLFKNIRAFYAKSVLQHLGLPN